MFRILMVLSVMTIIGFTSCTKTVSKKACFTFSKNVVKVNDTIFLFNCSEGYKISRWTMPNGATDTLRNSYYKAQATGVFEVRLTVGDYLFTDTVNSKQTFTVEP
jgi:hypothetical protein